MKQLLIIILFLSIVSLLTAQSIAIFDYDDRLNQEDTVAKYIEKQLLVFNSALHIEQFSGKENEEISLTILDQLDEKGYDLIITITSDALVLAMHTLKKTPTIFTNVNNPLIFGIRNLKKPGKNITGATYYVPIERQFALYKQIYPGMKNIGLFFRKKNKATRAEIAESRNVCLDMGIDYLIELINSENDLVSKTKRLIEEGVDSIVLSNDGLIYENVDKILPFTDKAGIPIFSFRNKGVSSGAVASLSTDYFKLVDEVVVPYAFRVLKGEKPGDIPIGYQKENDIELNQTKAIELGIMIPEEIINSAKKKY